MTILIYDYHELEERASKHLRVWKLWHTILYIFAAICGILNYTLLLETEKLVHDGCIFYPQTLDFHWVELPNGTSQTVERTDKNFILYNAARITTTTDKTITDSKNKTNEPNVTSAGNSDKVIKEDAEKEITAQTTPAPTTEESKRNKRDVPKEYITTEVETTVEERNGTMITANKTHRYMLNADRTLFPKETDTGCQLGEYMPLLSTVFACVWATLFIMCPSGGRVRSSGIQEPWRILLPAIIFAFAMVIMTGVSFTSTNSGLQAFCASFQNYTNTTTCSAVSPFLEKSWNLTAWDIGHRVAATRAAAAGVWASWACACALLLARCLSAGDFMVKHTSVTLVDDPLQKVTPHLKRQMEAQRSGRSAQSSPSKRDTPSVRSDPTALTELVSASVEHEPDSNPTSLMSTPVKDRLGEELEMVNVDRTHKRS